MASATGYLDLLDWRRRVFDLYADVRRAESPAAAWFRWRSERDRLFAVHSQSPIPPSERRGFPGLAYFDYDPSARVLADLTSSDGAVHEIETSTGSAYRFLRIGTAAFRGFGSRWTLEVYWLDGYAGGVFIPFRDGTSGGETYGGGRYLLDTVKGADLGMEDGRLVLDFNFSYNPSCAYDPQWVCPLTPPANRLPAPIRAGERCS
jgi:uncharacterized protein (DUF1684 family)